jgi:translation initiation factor IF-2
MKEIKKEKAKIPPKNKEKKNKVAAKIIKAKKPAKKPAAALIKHKVVHKTVALKHKPPVKKKEVIVAALTVEPPAAVIKVAPLKTPAIAKPVHKPVSTPAVSVQEVVLPPQPVAAQPQLKELELNLPITVKDLAVKLQEKPSVLIKTLMGMGAMAGINNLLDQLLVEKVCQKYGFVIKKALDSGALALGFHDKTDDPAALKPRAPIVTLMGHVDHGKTSLLDAIRKSKVTESEHGGITQHIGAYRVALPHGEITFLDTPGHEAFTAMRARGASVTDIVVLVVAADDGVMPQTEEAIDHAQAAKVAIIVAINKIDKPQADLDRVKKKLSEYGLLSEDWGGKTITVPVSAKTGEGINNLLEMILLEAQMLELKANPNRAAKGVVLEGKMIKNKGPVVTLLVQNGTLHLNDNIIVGNFYGKMRAMFNDHGRAITEAGPSLPMEVLGISSVPEAGEQFFVIDNEKTAKELAARRQEEERQRQNQPIKRIGLEDLYSQIKEGKIKELNLIIKTDAQGSLEAIKESLTKLNVSEIKINIIHDGVGNINSSDVMLALASQALILGFNITADDQAKQLIAKEGQDVRIYNVIYDLANDIKAALEGMLEPKLKRVFLGKAEIKKVFKLSRSGIVAGCMVIKGKIVRGAKVELVRNASTVYEGELSSLKRFKDDVREVEEGFECGLTISGFNQILEGDVIEAYQIEKIARKL